MREVTVIVKRLRSDAVIPLYAHPGDAGIDLVAVGCAITIPAGGRALVPTGIAVAIPTGYELQIRPRSGLALKEGLTVLNTPGTIDAGYRGEIGVILFNTNRDHDVVIETGTRVAQAVLARFETIVWQETDELPPSLRGDKGFGSTGRTATDRSNTVNCKDDKGRAL